jgi:creatinine amidohydrolase
MNTSKDPFPVMEHMTVKMVRNYLKEKQSIIIPVGVTEQHGYHLPLATDSIRAEKMGIMIGEQTGILVAPTLKESFSGGGCPGTINISPGVMSLVVSDMLLSLKAQGFKKFYFFICHGGSENITALENALKMLLRNNPSFDDAMVAMLPAGRLDIDNVSRNKACGEGDWHAGWHETSEIMYLAPELVRMEEFETDAKELLDLMTTHPDNYQMAEKIVDDECVVARNRQKDAIQVGVMGFPERASYEMGKKIVESTVKGACKKIEYLEANYDGKYKEINFIPAPHPLAQKNEK